MSNPTSNVPTRALIAKLAKGDPQMTRALEILFASVNPSELAPIAPPVGNLSGQTLGVLRSEPSLTPQLLGDIAFEATNDTTITVKLMGQDGVIRSATLTLV